MATSLAQVGITPVKLGWVASCTTCGWGSQPLDRRDADVAALEHRSSHGPKVGDHG